MSFEAKFGFTSDGIFSIGPDGARALVAAPRERLVRIESAQKRLESLEAIQKRIDSLAGLGVGGVVESPLVLLERANESRTDRAGRARESVKIGRLMHVESPGEQLRRMDRERLMMELVCPSRTCPACGR